MIPDIDEDEDTPPIVNKKIKTENGVLDKVSPNITSPKTRTTTTTTTITTNKSTSSVKTTPTTRKPVLIKKEIDSSSSDSSSDSSDSSSSDSSDSDSSSEDEKPKKAVTKKPSPASSKKNSPKPTATTPKKAAAKKKPEDSKGKKKTTRKRKIEETEEEDDNGKNRWWEEEGDEDGPKWQTLSHNGPVFPPAYIPHGTKFLYDGKVVKLTPEQEEVATFYANYLETDHVKKEAFRDNFFAEFRGLLTTEQKKTIKNLAKCDFSHIHTFLQERKETRKSRSKNEKDAEAAEKKKLQEKYGFAMIDGFKEKIGNFTIEPPGLFLGRGAHPKTGMLKQRIYPSDVTINIGKGENVPPSPIPGHEWKDVVHDNTVTWLAFWKESINGGTKYIWLAPSSKIKGQADRKKFEVARKLKDCIESIRKGYIKSFTNDSEEKRQLGVALYLIDFLALRVGNEKGEDQADTVGCCSLRVEHIKLGKDNTITLDFLGKDSMRYFNTVKIRPDAYKVLQECVKGKKPSELLFDDLSVAQLNTHLKKQMDGLSAKVFRTYNASITLQKELNKMDESEYSTIEEKILYYNRCNREVAILCNHQKAPPKNLSETLGKIDDKILEYNDLIDLCRIKLKLKPKTSDKDDIEEREKERLKKLIEANIAKKEENKTDKEVSFDTKATFERSRNIPDGEQKINDKIDKYEKQIKKLEIQKTTKDELKTVALGTSKINYLDPRITVSFCKKWGIPVEKIFSKALRDKFPWSDVDKSYKF
ncbi:hypothetical protein DICPUDRAFT_50979 [Dictyostelium purpureum]|uniref:DNA topoisomerase I n=1 Tax=Dictyostelium purpureum TaxID=5786 RepID=F1A1A6_DICPU|nr:uncharacterized protein DICPUDRAFT_50979 [Dictyostelium purpureum]EGC30025.1 hypothetical protein DICPUDRAFT_50979 [Dictyostelium purpureum]|eukprot:XP_003293452.1 hypothetical protein DICPUDRAFT_50979 [Dictyostelium purpureum]